MPKALDLFCSAGGVSVGLQRAGFDVTGIDILPQPHYRGGTFKQGDAMEVLQDRSFLRSFDFIHASPPCQGYSPLRHLHPKSDHVVGAPLRDPWLLCGSFFGLGCVGEDGVYRPLRRHRLFEVSWGEGESLCRCDGRQCVGVYGGGATRPGVNSKSGWSATAPQAREALGIDWMNRTELAQAIPPAYAEWLGQEALAKQQAKP